MVHVSFLSCFPLVFPRESVPLAVKLQKTMVEVANAEESSLGGLAGNPSVQALQSDLKVSNGFDLLESYKTI